MADGGRGPYLLKSGEGESVWSLGGRWTVKVDGAASEGRFSMFEALFFQSSEPPLHIHHREDEAFYVLDGRMTLYVGDEVVEAGAGSFAFAPKEIPHTFTVDVEPTRVLLLASPANFERYALELGEPATGDVPPAELARPDPNVIGPVAERYGIEIVGPPRRAHH